MKFCFGILLLLLLSGCRNDTLTHSVKDYQRRVARILDTEPPEPVTISLPPLPAKKHLRQKIPETNIALREFYDLDKCYIKPIIAKRNTSLGKLQTPSQRLLYEHELLSALSDCLPLYEKGTAIHNITEQKRQQYPLVWANLMTQSEEIRSFFAAPRSGIEGNGSDGLAQVTPVLRLLDSLASYTTVEDMELELQLQQLAQYPLLSQMTYSQRYLRDNLNQTQQWLVTNQSRLKCHTERPDKTKLRYLQNVFNRYFIGQIQPLASELNRYHYTLSPLLQALSKQPSLPTEFVAYIENYHHGFNDYKTAMASHIGYWQSLYQSCNITPGKPATPIPS